MLEVGWSGLHRVEDANVPDGKIIAIQGFHSAFDNWKTTERLRATARRLGRGVVLRPLILGALSATEEPSGEGKVSLDAHMAEWVEPIHTESLAAVGSL